jgi:hypothetical protein
VKKKKSNPATEFSNYLGKVLRGKKFEGLDTWRPWGPPKAREAVDVAGLRSKSARVLVEVERLREDPASNVIKVWQWLCQGSVPDNVTFVQAFSKRFKDSKAPRKERACFVALKMKREFPKIAYHPIDFDYNPKSGAKGIGGAAKKHARELAEKIQMVWESPSKNK